MRNHKVLTKYVTNVLWCYHNQGNQVSLSPHESYTTPLRIIK